MKSLLTALVMVWLASPVLVFGVIVLGAHLRARRANRWLRRAVRQVEAEPRLVPSRHPNIQPNRWGVLGYDPWGQVHSLTDSDVVEIEASGTCEFYPERGAA